MEVIIKTHMKRKGGKYYTVHAYSGEFSKILGRYKTRAKAESVKLNFMRHFR